jgi:hypothetical protein
MGDGTGDVGCDRAEKAVAEKEDESGGTINYALGDQPPPAPKRWKRLSPVPVFPPT